MKSCVVFAGPSLCEQDRGCFEAITFRPPARRYDILRETRNGVGFIGIADLAMSPEETVTHKEILWAIANGVAVYGSSGGAILAAELSIYGMHGIGLIAEQYLDGTLTADAEVAKVGSALRSNGLDPYHPVSQADLRATLQSLTERQILSSVFATRLLALSASIHYRERSWTRIVQKIVDNRTQRENLRQLLMENHIQQQRLDALNMLGQLERDFETAADHPPKPTFWPPITPVLRSGLGAISGNM